jgi:thiol-disulfide isomerase/thioredoxin
MESNPQSTRKFFLWGSLLVILWALYLIFFAHRPPAGAFRDGDPAVYDLALEDLQGKPVSFEKLKKKPVFLHFWATWCPPCVIEMPLIEELAQNPRLSKVEFLCVSLDDNLEAVRAFMAEHKLKLTVVRSLGDLPEIYRSDPPVVPMTFLINADGRVMKRRVGAQPWNEPANLQEIETVMQLKPEKPAESRPAEGAPAADPAAR